MLQWTPFNDLARLQAQLDRVFDGGKQVEEVFRPAVDIIEDAGKILITADLPGVSQESLELNVDREVLTLKGERKLARPAQPDADHYRRFERTSGAFERSFRLPPSVDVEKINAQMKDGVLTLTLPKKAEAQPRQIKVSVQS
jgi:HSP20 family protein